MLREEQDNLLKLTFPLKLILAALTDGAQHRALHTWEATVTCLSSVAQDVLIMRHLLNDYTKKITKKIRS